MIVERCIPLNHRQEWIEALEDVPHGFGHTWGNCHAMHLTTGHPTYLYVCESSSAKVVCPFAERTFEDSTDIMTPYGFSGVTGNGVIDQFHERWLAFARSRRYVCGYIALNPLFSNTSGWHPSQVFTGRDLYIIDLQPSVEDLFRAMSANRRRYLRADQQVEVTHNNPTAREFLATNLAAFLERKGAGPVYRFTRDTIEHLLHDPGVWVAGVDHCASAFGWTQHGADYLFNVSEPPGQQNAAVLIWDAVLRLKSMQIPWLNLGGGAREGDGITEFKRRFGARRVPFSSLRQIYDRERFARICAAAGVEPAADSEYFPPYRRSERPHRKL